MKRTLFLISAILSLAAAASEPSVKAYVDDPTVIVGRPFMIRVEINGRTSNMPQMPAVDGLRISAQPNAQSTRMEFSSTTNQIVNKQEYGYTARALKPGKFVIPPITVIVGGKSLQTEPVEITAEDVGVPQAQSSGAAGGASERSRANDGQVSLEEAVFIESSVDKSQVYRGEAVELTLSVWVMDLPGFRAGNYRGQTLEPPTCEGFYATPIEAVETSADRDGRPFTVLMYRRVLYPTVAGELKIGEWKWSGGAAYGFDRWDVERTAPAIPVRVLDLPATPPNFSGAVGEFVLEAQVSRNEAVQGVPIQLVVTVKGKGNPDAIGAPSLPKIQNAYVSDPDRKSLPQNSLAAGVEKTFTYNVTPLQPGTLTIPPMEFCYFEPSSASYKTQSSRPVTVMVRESTESAPRPVVVQNSETVEAGSVSMLGDDIFPLAAAPGNLRPQRRSDIAWPAATAAPVLAFAGVALVMRRRKRFESDPAYARAYHARARALKRLQGAAGAEEPAEELYKALIGYVADTHNLQESGLTSQEVGQMLEADGAPGETQAHVRKILRACERSRYGGGKLSDDEVQALSQAALACVEQLDRPQEGGRAQ